MDRLALLRQNPTFAPLSPEDLSRLADVTTAEHRPAGTLIVKEGEPGDALYVIASGMVKIFVTNDEGGEVTVAELGPADAFGEMALITGDPRSASVQAEEDTELLALSKNDFDRILGDTPALARSILETVCRRLSQANLRVEQEADHLLALRDLLDVDVGEPATILGTTRQALQLRKSAELASSNDRPLLVLGEAGTEKKTIAQMVHHGSQRAAGTFLSLDCGDVPPVVPPASTAETSVLLEEMAQLSALFGHQKGAFSFARTHRLGYLELAKGGTLVLENVDRLTPSVQERLLAYLKSGKSRAVGSSREIQCNARIVATSNPGIEGDLTTGRFSAELHAILSGQTILVPPLRERKRDLVAWVDHLIKEYSTRLGKDVQGITKEAMNLILAYDWPDNMEELRSVVQRGVRLADGPTLTPEQIFIGLAAFEPGNKINLLRLPFLRKALESPLYPGLLQTLAAIVLGFAILSALIGPQRSDSNVSLVLIWAIWWPLLVLGTVLCGRLFCGICPFAAIGGFFQRRWSLKQKVPTSVKQYGPYAAAAGFLAIIWVEQVTEMATSPIATAILLISILAGAVGTSLVLDRAAWCRYLCPLGRMIGTYASLSLVELRPNSSVCTAECKTHGCYTGTDRAGGCPMFEGAFAIQSNEACKLCAQCIKSCTNRAIRLNLRPPASEIWALPQHSLAVAAMVPILVATVAATHVRATGLYRQWMGGLDLEWLAYLGLLSVLAAVFYGLMALTLVTLRAKGEPVFARGLFWVPYVFLPLAMAGEISHQMVPLLSGVGTLAQTLVNQFGLGDWQSAAAQTAPATPGIQAAVLALGLLGSVCAADRLLVRYRPSARGLARLPVFVLAGLLTLSYGFLFSGD